jgi:hypothetical protein
MNNRTFLVVNVDAVAKIDAAATRILRDTAPSVHHCRAGYRFEWHNYALRIEHFVGAIA